MKRIGICGSSGSGKSTVCDAFRNQGIPVLDCDQIYHEMVSYPSDCLREIGERFGSEYVKGGFLDRKKLGPVVFADLNKLKLLNEISHRHVISFVEKKTEALEKNGCAMCVIDAPLLFESGLDQRCDAVIAVISDEELKISRICARDGIDRQAAKKRISSQLSDKELRNKADFIIENNGTVKDLLETCKLLIESLSLL